MKLRNTLCAIALAIFTASGGGAETAPADASSFTALEAALKGETWSNAIVGVADQISNPYVEFVAPEQYTSSGTILPFAFDYASFDPENMHWRQYCDGQKIVEEKVERDWNTILEALQARAETLGVSAEDIRRHDFDQTPDPYLTWRALDDRGMASDSSSKAIFALVGQFYLEVLGQQIGNRLCEITEQEMALGVSGTNEAIEIIKASLIIEQPNFIDMAKGSGEKIILADVDHLKLVSPAVIFREDGIGVIDSDRFPAEVNVFVAAFAEDETFDWNTALGFPQNSLDHQAIRYLASLLHSNSIPLNNYWPHVTQALAEVKPKSVRLNLLAKGRLSGEAYWLFESCALLDGVDLKILNVSAEGEYASDITLNDCNLRSLTISNGSIEGLWMNRASVTGAVVLEDLVVQRGLYLNDLKARDVWIENVRAWRTDYNEKPGVIDNPVAIELYNAQVEDEIDVRSSSVKDFWAGKAQAKVFRISDSTFTGVANMWGVTASVLFFSGNKAKELTAWHSHWQTIEISHSDQNVGKIETITLNHLRADGRFYLGQTEIGTADMPGMRTGDFEMRCLRIRDAINLEDAMSTSFFGLSRIDARKINLKRVRAESLRFYNDELAALVASPTGADDTAVPARRETLSSSLYSDGKCQLESTIGILDLEDAEFDRVRLATTIRQQLFANGAKIGALIVPGNRSAFDAGADLNLRHAEIGSLVLSLGALKPAAETKRQLSVEGATISAISVYDRDKDDDSIQIKPTETAAEPAPQDHDCENRNGQERLRCLYIDELLPAMGVTVDKGRFVSQDDGQYSGAVYRTLRAAADRGGYPELSQSLAIIQNDHYAASVASGDPIKSLFYTLGYHINRYGYENSRGVVILGGIWLFGFVILNLGFFGWLLSKRALWGVRKRLGPRLIAKLGEGNWQGLKLSHIFLSVDRTIPSLALDNEFAQPAAGSGQKFGTGVLAALYLQRLCAFVVIAFMLGGVFNVFQ